MRLRFTIVTGERLGPLATPPYMRGWAMAQAMRMQDNLEVRRPPPPPPPPVVAKPVIVPPTLRHWWKPSYDERMLLPWHAPKCTSTILRTIGVDDVEWRESDERPGKGFHGRVASGYWPVRPFPIVDWNDDLDLGCEDVECWR